MAALGMQQGVQQHILQKASSMLGVFEDLLYCVLSLDYLQVGKQNVLL